MNDFLGNMPVLLLTIGIFAFIFWVPKLLGELIAIRKLLAEVNHRAAKREEGREAKVMEQLEAIRSLLVNSKPRE